MCAFCNTAASSLVRSRLGPVFKNAITNLIQWAPIDASNPFSAWTPKNIAEATITGAEIGLTTNLSGWFLTTSASYTETEDEETGKELLRRPRTNFKLSLDKSFNALDTGVDVYAQSSLYNDAANTVEYGSYGTADLRFAYNFVETFKVQFKASNIFDKDYTTSSGSAGTYASMGRGFHMNLIYTPKF